MSILQRAVVAAGGQETSGSEGDLWTRLLVSKAPGDGLDILQKEGVLGTTFPEVQAMVGFGGQGHKDLWAHTKQVVRQVKPRPVLRWAALLHDVGKVPTFSKASGKVTFHHHEAESARMARRALSRTGYLSPDDQKLATLLIRDLGLVEAYLPTWTDSAVRRLHKEVDSYFHDLLLLSRADITTKHEAKRARILQEIHNLEERALAIRAQDLVVPPLPSGLGDVLTQAFGIPPSKRLGDLMTALRSAVENGNLERQREASYYVAEVEADRPKYGL